MHSEFICPQDRIDFASEMALASGKIVRKYFRSAIGVQHKADATPVTIADQETEAAIVSMIRSKYPTDGIIGEEGGCVNPDSPWQWVIDPIDGTKSFVMGGLDFGTIIGLLYKKKPVLGVVHQPILGELYVGNNHQATLNGQPIHVAPVTQLSDAYLVVTDLFDLYKKFPNHQKLDELFSSVKSVRTWGNCYGYMLIAQGLCHIMFEPNLHLWDMVGVIPVVQGAGGTITDCSGQDPLIGMSLLASVPSLHQQILKSIRKT